MFGFSLQKLLVLAAIVLAVWYGFKWVSRLQEARDAGARVPPRKRRWPGDVRGAFRGAFRGGGKAPEPQDAAEELTPCRVCDAYVAARGASHCGRADCPY